MKGEKYRENKRKIAKNSDKSEKFSNM